MSEEPAESSFLYPPGHFYSPIVNTRDVEARAKEIWPEAPETLGIDFRPHEHQRILTEVFPRYIEDYRYAERESETGSNQEYFTQNGQFSWLDSRALFVFLRDLRPRRIIEIGSGFSSLLTADVNRRFFDQRIVFECVDPYPQPFLEGEIPGLGRFVREPVERVDLSFFTRLEAGDILFIDSSHVAKTGSDVNFLFFEVLPRLAPGVRVHLYAIFLPAEYPRDWVANQNRSWNEQYLLRALLMYSTGFRVMFGSNYAVHRFPELVSSALGRSGKPAFGGASFWIERV
jgi:hypothetical protein